MESLQEIIKILNKRKLGKLEIIDPADLNSKDAIYTRFYEGVYSGDLKSDHDAAHLFYGAKPTDARYRKLKSRFRKR